MKRIMKRGISAALLLSVMSLPTPALAKNDTFKDIDSNQWYYEDVQLTAASGLMIGKSGQIFDPHGDLTLAEAISIAARIREGYENKSISDFSSPDEAWYQDDVAFAVHYGIIDKNQFDGQYQRVARRDEVAGIFAYALPTEGYDTRNPLNKLPDVDQTNPYYEPIMTLYQSGIMVGIDDHGAFQPAKSITRAEVAAITNRVTTPEKRQTVTTGSAEKPAEQETDLAQQLLTLMNEDRKKAGLSPLTYDAALSSAAAIRAKETTQNFSHTRPNGKSCFTVMEEAGISYRYAAENILYGSNTAQSAHTQWMNSSGHRQNILSPSATHVGIGIYTDQSGVMYWCQLFMAK